MGYIRIILTLAELEFATCLGLTGFLTLNRAGIAGQEAFCTESLLVSGLILTRARAIAKRRALACPL